MIVPHGIVLMQQQIQNFLKQIVQHLNIFIKTLVHVNLVLLNVQHVFLNKDVHLVHLPLYGQY